MKPKPAPRFPSKSSLTLCLASLLTLSPSSAQQTTAPAPAATEEGGEKEEIKAENDITGAWVSTFQGKNLVLEFHPDGNVVIREGDKEPKPCTYAVRLDKTPMEIDFTSEEGTRLSIFRFEKDGALTMARPSDHRAENFEGDARPATFTKVKQASELEPAPFASKPKPAAQEKPESLPTTAEGDAALVLGKWQGEFKGKKLLLEFKPGGALSVQEGAGRVQEGTYQIRPDVSPKQLDLVIDEDDVYCIYRFEENGELTITEPALERPATFAPEFDPVSFHRIDAEKEASTEN